MVHPLKRMTKLHRLLWIRNGPGALVLPKEVSKISMEFNAKIYGGHHGARKFWRNMLPKMKYHNPSVPIQISRHTDPDGPSLLHVYMNAKTQPATGTTNSPIAQQSDSTPPSGTPNARNTLVPDTSTPAFSINLRNQTDSEILAELVEKTGAKELETPEEERIKMQELEEARERSEADRILMAETLAKERREAELLKLARGEIAS